MVGFLVGFLVESVTPWVGSPGGQWVVRMTGIAAGSSILVMDGGGANTRVGMGGDLTSGTGGRYASD